MMARLSESAKKIVGIWMHCLQFTRNTQDSSRLANDTLDSTVGTSRLRLFHCGVTAHDLIKTILD